ncbi:hypothetical protein [Martelella endophytica]|uniref:hypothetical protein n=1 Tax=Martelella endophytica TaxID=1486262 RepID=UPI00130E362A|nr:hypothetical protein [Martelella endophytica]
MRNTGAVRAALLRLLAEYCNFVTTVVTRQQRNGAASDMSPKSFRIGSIRAELKAEVWDAAKIRVKPILIFPPMQ